MILRMDSGKKQAVFQFLKPQEAKQMMSFIAGASGKLKYPVDVRLSQIIQYLAAVFQG